MSFDDFDALLKRRPASQRQRHPVLVIDDDPVIRDGLAILLEKRYELTLCSSAEEGLNALNDDICSIVLDVKMPGLDGFWACSEIRKKAPTVPVIFYSAYQDAKNPYTIINDHRPFGYVVKGGNTKKLLEMLEVAVKLHSVVVANRRLLASLNPSELDDR